MVSLIPAMVVVISADNPMICDPAFWLLLQYLRAYILSQVMDFEAIVPEHQPYNIFPISCISPFTVASTTYNLILQPVFSFLLKQGLNIVESLFHGFGTLNELR